MFLWWLPKYFLVILTSGSGGAFDGFWVVPSSEIHALGVVSYKHERVGAKWRCISWNPLTINSRFFPTAPSQQLYCICGAITVRGRQQTRSSQSRWLGWTLYLLWDTLWTHISVYFCSLWLWVSVPLHERALWPARCGCSWYASQTSQVSQHLNSRTALWESYHAFDSFSGI